MSILKNPFDDAYKYVLRDILERGVKRPNRTGVGSIALPASFLQFDLSDGKFPLLTLKKMPIRSIAVELEGFINGITDKAWYQDRGCRIWNEWCNPLKVPYGTDADTKAKMAEENDLGPIYGSQWRDFCGSTLWAHGDMDYEERKHHRVDQLQTVLDSLKKTPENRRMVVSAWNPIEQPAMALPPCHFAWQVLVFGDTLHLNWMQRSCDYFLGIPFNISSYALLLCLLADSHGFKRGTLTGMLGDTHLYDNQIEAAHEVLSRESFEAPELVTNCNDILAWTHDKLELKGYQAGLPVKVPVVV